MRDLRIQELRGAAVVLVVVLHALILVDDRPGSLADLFPNDRFGAMGVDLFFVISGAVMAGVLERGPRPAAFLRDRARRLLPLWWLAAAVFLALAAVSPLDNGRDALLNTLTLVPLFDCGRYTLPIPGVGWTLGYEAVFYLVVAAALAMPRGLQARLAPLELALLGAAGVIVRPTSPLGGHLCNAILFEFLLGMIAVRAARTAWVKRISPGLAAAGLAALVVPMMLGCRFETDQWAVVEGRTGLLRAAVWGLPCAALLAGLVARPDRRTRAGLLGRLGDASYSIYLSHTFFTILSCFLWSWRTALGRDVLVLSLVAGGLRVGLSVHRRIETPLLARLGRQTSAAASANTVSPRSLTSANPPSTWMRAETLLAPE